MSKEEYRKCIIELIEASSDIEDLIAVYTVAKNLMEVA